MSQKETLKPCPWIARIIEGLKRDTYGIFIDSGPRPIIKSKNLADLQRVCDAHNSALTRAETPNKRLISAAGKLIDRIALCQRGVENYAELGGLSNDLNDEVKAALSAVESAAQGDAFHRRLGITLLDAKWLDPECHNGCKSLVLKGLLDEALDALYRLEMHASILRSDERTTRMDDAIAEASKILVKAGRKQ